MFSAYIQRLELGLKEGLPGEEAQFLMAPVHRMKPDINSAYFNNARKGCVLAFLYPVNEEPWILLTKRPDYKGVHGNQVSFPGGKQEPGDKNLLETALREAAEEVGLSPNSVTVIGHLSELYIPPSNFRVLPWLGFADFRPEFVPDPVEVAGLVECPLKRFFDPSIRGNFKIHVREDILIEAPAFEIDGHIIWGATAMMISELLFLASRCKLFPDCNYP